MRAGIQLYTLRSVDEPVPALLERVAAAGYDGVEFAYRVAEADPAAVAATLAETGLAVPGMHVGEAALRDGLAATTERAEVLGCDRLVVASLDERRFRSAEAVDEAAALLSDLAEVARGHGLELCYHNHDHEFVDLGGEFAWARLVEATDDVTFELDVGWAVAGGGDPGALLDRYGERIPLVHVTDVNEAGESVEVGEGVVDLEAAARAARAADVEWLLYENDDPTDPLASLDRGAATLARLIE